MSPPRIVYLTAPKISASHIKEKITCIRAHRERMFNVSTSIHNDKLICHNYGQGGAGWTFLFGCVNESVRQFEQELKQKPTLKNKPISVIGAGCYGLLTAITLTRRGHTVQIVAKEINNLPSYNAAGFFFPRPRRTSTPNECSIFEELGIESFKTYLQIIKKEHPFINAGPKLLPAYYGLDIDPGFAPYIVHGLVNKPEKVTVNFGNKKNYDAMEYKTVFINPAIIMQELNRTITELGVRITKKDIETFDNISEQIIFNCAGLGAKKLTQDKLIIPVQGHLISLKNQPDVSQLQYMINFKVASFNSNGKPNTRLIYFAPKEEGILGITFLRGKRSLIPNYEEFDLLLQRCANFFY